MGAGPSGVLLERVARQRAVGRNHGFVVPGRGSLRGNATRQQSVCGVYGRAGSGCVHDQTAWNLRLTEILVPGPRPSENGKGGRPQLPDQTLLPKESLCFTSFS